MRWVPSGLRDVAYVPRRLLYMFSPLMIPPLIRTLDIRTDVSPPLYIAVPITVI
jgi:hypothetical protein